MTARKAFFFLAAILCSASILLTVRAFVKGRNGERMEPLLRNRLAQETSPYLRQHADNPVHWLPWSEEAFELARKLDRPIFLSIGYSTCHWCHVMERESFEDPEIARILNDQFISVKVDREERPEVDEIYMRAVLLFTNGHGGWPMSVFLTPEGQPFFGGTYFPPEAFRRILLEVARLWREERSRVVEAAESTSRATAAELSLVFDDPKALDERTLTKGEEAFLRSADRVHGGFGRAPKFPLHSAFDFLMTRYERSHRLPVWEVVELSLVPMACGGLYDHIGGGFHRYCVDEKWLVPHFEKMLYDNAQLAAVYSRAYYLDGNDLFRQVALRTYQFVLRELTGPEGAFYSALDAESPTKPGGPKEEGAFYLWTPPQVIAVLGEEDGRLFCSLYDISEEGNFINPHTGYRGSIPNRLKRPILSSKSPSRSEEVAPSRMAEWVDRLRRHRDTRLRPLRDEKIVVSWNGLMISSLARGFLALGEEGLLQAAVKAGEFLWQTAGPAKGQLFHTIQDGQAKVPAFLDDYAFLALGYLDLYQATKESVWRERAERLAEWMIRDLWDGEAGGFWFAAHRKDLIAVSKPSFDGSEPSGNGIAVQVLLRLAALKDSKELRDKAVGTLRAFGGLMLRMPHSCPSLLSGLDLYLSQEKKAVEAFEIVRLRVSPDKVRIPVNRSATVTLILHIAPGWHIYGSSSGRDYQPTRVSVASEGVQLTATRFPPPKKRRFGYIPSPMNVYEGRVEIGLELKGLKEGAYSVRINCKFQPCDDKACLTPQDKSVVLPVMVVPATDRGAD